MKSLILFSAFLSTTAMAASLSDFSGDFTVSCDNRPEVVYAVKVNFSAEENVVWYEETANTEDRYTFNGQFNNINAGKIVTKRPSETFGCLKETRKTTFTGNKLTFNLSEKHCYIPGILHSNSVESLILKANGDLRMEAKNEFWENTCEFKRN